MFKIDLKDYNYHLPPERIAQYPVKERDESQLLLYRENTVSKDFFKNIDKYLPSDSLLVFNNTRVIRARMLFKKPTGSVIEIFCLEPLFPSDYVLSLSCSESVEWKCIIGNQKKWKSRSLSLSFSHNFKRYTLKAEKAIQMGEAWSIRFSLDPPGLTFGEILEAVGHIPLPPYLRREEKEDDYQRYQTVYSSVKGSVAAPTAGLHFTEDVLRKIKDKGISTAELTLHVGAGTFKPVKSDNLEDHQMHTEHFSISKELIESLISHKNNIIAVGTTSARTLESLYWIGVRLSESDKINPNGLTVGQWEPYNYEGNCSVNESFDAILRWMKNKNTTRLQASTTIMIVPGYKFKIINGLITNFHQPSSTLLLLISAWTGDNWKKIYSFAMDNGFRFLSYGDSSLLIK
jgi:S-adenosylmethionine:tRNA ribosyltransferase-isomerase